MNETKRLGWKFHRQVELIREMETTAMKNGGKTSFEKQNCEHIYSHIVY